MSEDLSKHKFAKLIRDYINDDVCLPVEKIERDEREKIYWGFQLGEAELFILLYQVQSKHGSSDVYLWVNAIVAKLEGRNADEVMRYMLKQNFEMPHIFRFCIDKDTDSICVQFRMATEYITEAHLCHRLETLGLFANEVFESLRREFDLRPFQRSYTSLQK